MAAEQVWGVPRLLNTPVEESKKKEAILDLGVPTGVMNSRVFRCVDAATDKWGMCFYLRTEPKTQDKPRHLFVSAAHVFSAAAQPMIDGSRLAAVIITSIPGSDLAILQIEELLTQFPQSVAATQVNPDISQGEKAFIVGAGGSVVLPAVISKTCAVGTFVFGKKVPEPADGRKPNRFFVLDRTADRSFSGSPVVNKWGNVIGVFCDADREGGCSWVLSVCHMLDALVPEVNGSAAEQVWGVLRLGSLRL